MKIDDSDGYLDLDLGGEVPMIRLDLFFAYDSFVGGMAGYKPDAEGSVADYYARLKKVAGELDLPTISGRTAELIQRAVFERVDSLRKKDVSPETTR